MSGNLLGAGLFFTYLFHFNNSTVNYKFKNLGRTTLQKKDKLRELVNVVNVKLMSHCWPQRGSDVSLYMW